jgi:AcrR family transcriptional regulator
MTAVTGENFPGLAPHDDLGANVTTTVERRPRADASRNRERIIAAARDLLGDGGPDVPFLLSADRAGAANATLYRHFEDRLALVREVTMSSLERIADQAEEALRETSDAFGALEGFVHRAASERIGSMCAMLTEDFNRSDPRVLATRTRLEVAVEALMERARAAGQLRDDVGLGDLMVAITQLTRPIAGSQCRAAEHYVSRHLSLFLDGLRAPARSELSGSPVTFEDLTT